MPQAWLHEFQVYLQQPRMTAEEFNVRYTLLRMDAEKVLKPVMTEEETRAFYQGHHYMLWRNLVHRRHSAWRRVLATMRGSHGIMLEVGCAIAPVSAWCATRKKTWEYYLWDLYPSPHAEYGMWRVRQRVPSGLMMWPRSDRANVITALDVFEHLSDPVKMARQCIETLAPGGYLHWNFVGNPLRNDLDLATSEQRDETMALLTRELTLVTSHAGYRVSRR